MATVRTHDVLRHVRELIVTGQVRAGDYLRLEPLATTLGVSVTPVREAMMHLRSEGLVEWQPKRGFRVLPLSSADIEDIYRVQAFVAGDLASRAVDHLSPHELDRLEELQDELEEAHTAGDADRVEELNHEFHRRINLAADSPRLAWFLQVSSQFAPRLFFAQIEGWSEASATDHREIIAALRAGDADAAGHSMRMHVARAGELLAAHVDQHAPEVGFIVDAAAR
jgi:DNA-binding GntR family transcriptional regulator